MPTLAIRDETTNGEPAHEFLLEVPAEHLTVRELIRSRVYQEVQDWNRRCPPVFRGLIQPTEAEQSLNGFAMKDIRQIDWKRQFDRAVEAFNTHRVIILVDDQHIDDIDAEITLRQGTVVSFLRLTPLTGG